MRTDLQSITQWAVRLGVYEQLARGGDPQACSCSLGYRVASIQCDEAGLCGRAQSCACMHVPFIQCDEAVRMPGYGLGQQSG